jgi:hypothetical protein
MPVPNTLGNTAGATKDGAPYTAGSADTFITNQPGVTDSIVIAAGVPVGAVPTGTAN